MASAKRRSLYGSVDTYLEIWGSLADVLESLEDIDADFAEYKYRDSLVEQVKYWPWSGMGEEVQGGWPILEKLVNFIVEK